MSSSSKREANSPAMGDDHQGKRRNIHDDPPSLICLDEISGESSQSDGECEIPTKTDERPIATLSTDEKVECLIGRMDTFFQCFNVVQKKAARTERKNTRKFKHLESAHNELLSKVVDASSSTDSRIKDLEDKLVRSEDANKDLTDKLSSLEANFDRHVAAQHSVNADNYKKMNSLEMNLGYTDKNILDLASEVKERKVIISRVQETVDEDVSTAALEAINKVINTAIADIHPDDSLDGLRILMPMAIDNVYRIGKPKGGRFNRNISVTFIRVEDREMVLRVHRAIKGNDDVKYFISDDLTSDGRALKAQLKRISAVAKSKGLESKVSGNRVVVDSRPYAANELALIPGTVSVELKQEKYIDGGIVYRGDRSIYSNFFPAPFNLKGEDYAHVEQFYQYKKALHHNEFDTAERILKLSNPWRIKVLGDNVEANDDWNAIRMKTLYEGVSAKFRQNWPLHDELLRSKGLKLYEATTDLYFACGVGYDSRKWSTMDWTGENVAGLIVMKVRDELLLESQGCLPDNNTLTQIAVERNDSSNMAVDEQDPTPLESTVIHRDEYSCNNTSTGHPVSSQTPTYTEIVKSPGKWKDGYQQFSQRSRGSQPRNRGQYRGGRGRQSPPGRQYSPRSYYHSTPNRGHGRPPGRVGFNNRRPHDKLSADDKNFLFGYSSTRRDEDGYVTPRKTTKSPTPGTQPVCADKLEPGSGGILSLTEHQRKGLVELGLIPESAFVKNIVSTTQGPSAAT